jgi:ribosome-associated toxin RatA of RatAB toxin-antitoxin module
MIGLMSSMHTRSFVRGALTCALTCALTVAPASAGVEPGTFTAQEWRKLEAGETVLRPATRMQGGVRMYGGSSWQVIDAPPSAVWSALLDTARYPKMMPQVTEAKLVKDSPEERTVYLRQGHKGLLEARYFLKVRVYEDRHDLTFTVDDSRPREVLQSGGGFYSVRPYQDGRTLVAYGVMADFRGGVLGAVVRDNVHEWMLRTPWLVKRFLEGSGRSLYR